MSSTLSAANWAPRSSSPRGPLIIRAPLTTTSSSSGSELDPLSSSDEEEGSGFGSESEPEAEAAPATPVAEARPSLIPVARVTNDDDVDEGEESFDDDDVDEFHTFARVSAPLVDKDGSLAGDFDLGEAEGGKVEILGPVGEAGVGLEAMEEDGVTEDSEIKDVEPSDGEEVGFLGENRSAGENVEKDWIFGGSPILERKPEVEGEEVEVLGSVFDDIVEGGMRPESMEIEADATELEEDLKLEKVDLDAAGAEEINRASGEGKEAEILSENDEKDRFLGEKPIFESKLIAEGEKDEVLGSGSQEIDAVTEGGMSTEAMPVEADATGEEEDGVDEDLKHEDIETDDADTEETCKVLGEDPILEEGNEETRTARENADRDGVSNRKWELLKNYRIHGGVESKLDDSEGSGIMVLHEIEEDSGDIDVLNGKDEMLQGESEQISSIIEGEMGSRPMKVEYNIIDTEEKGEIALDSENLEVKSSAGEAEQIDTGIADPDRNYGPVGKGDGISIEETRIKPYSEGDSEVAESLNEISAPADDLKLVEDFGEDFDAVSETEAVTGSTIKLDTNLLELQNELVAESGDPIISKYDLSVSFDKDANTVDIEGVFEESSRTVQNNCHSAKSEGGKEQGSFPDPRRAVILKSTDATEQLIEVSEKCSSNSSNYSHNVITRKIILNPDEKVDANKGEGKELPDTATLLQLLRVAAALPTNGNTKNATFVAPNVASANHPAGLGSSVHPLKPVRPKKTEQTFFTSQTLEAASEPDIIVSEKEKKFHEEIESIRVKFLRIVHKLGHSLDDNVAASVLYHLTTIEDTKNWIFSFNNARKKAVKLEREEKDKLNFSCNILIIGKSGVGKSATVNSIFEEEKSTTNPFKPETNSVRKIEGVMDGIKIQIIDTPGLSSCLLDQQSNRKILSSVKKCMRRCTPDVVLYVDRLDTRTRDSDDLPLLRMITSTLGSSVWSKAIIALTHAAAAPPEGPSGLPLSYEASVTQKSQFVQQLIRQAAGDVRLLSPVVLVENHPSCRRNRQGQRVLPNGSSWRSQLLLLCYSSKILSESNSLSKVKDFPVRKLVDCFRSPPMHLLLSSLDRKAHAKLSSGTDSDVDLDLDLNVFLDEDNEEDEYDQLQPFRPLTKSQAAKLTREQRRAYFDEYDYRVKFLQKKHWKEKIKRFKEFKRRLRDQDGSRYDGTEDFDNTPNTISTLFPDMMLPRSFDCDDAVYHYRSLEPSSQFFTAPFLDLHGWDHDCGFDSVSLENTLNVAGQFPGSISVKHRQDKKRFSIHMDSSIPAKHGESGSTLASFDIETIGNQLSHCFRADTRFRNLKKNESTSGFSVNLLKDTVATGLKFEEQISVGRRVDLSLGTAAVQAEGYTGYGAILETKLREKDSPCGQALTTLGLSLVKYHRNLVFGGTLKSHVSVGRNSKVSFRVGLNNKKRGQLAVKASSSEQIQIYLVGLIPLLVSIFKRIWPDESSSGTRHYLLD